MAVQYWKQARPEAGPNTVCALKTGLSRRHDRSRQRRKHRTISCAIQTLTLPDPYGRPSYCYRCPLKMTFPECRLACLDPIEQVLRNHRGELAGFIIEPLMQAAAGMIAQPPGYLKRIRELCTKYEVLLIADEVATGFGRTGTMFACHQEGVTPDLMAISKGLTGGYLPLAATLTTEDIYRAFLGSMKSSKHFSMAIHRQSARVRGGVSQPASVPERENPGKIALQNQPAGPTAQASPSTASCRAGSTAGLHGRN